MQENNHRHQNNFDSSESRPALSELTKQEQEHRHQWQDNYLKSQNNTFRLGQLFGFAYNIALLYLVYDLIQQEEKKLALAIFVINALVIIFGLLITSSQRRPSSRKPGRNGDRRFQGRDNRDRRDYNPNRNSNNNNRDRNRSR